MDERKNKEGYMDLTAYSAINHVGVGDIYLESNDKGEKAYIVLNEDVNEYGFCPALVLFCDKAYPDDVPVKVRNVMYGTPGKLGVLKIPTRLEYIRTASEEEVDEVKKKVGESIGITVANVIYKPEPEPINNNLELVANVRASIYEKVYNDLIGVLNGRI